MSDMKCPFCNTPLVHENMSDYWCVHCNTQEQKGLYGSDKLWQELIRTRKTLDVAVGALKRLEKELYFNNAKQTGHIADSVISIPSIALEQITALEQKDVK